MKCIRSIYLMLGIFTEFVYLYPNFKIVVFVQRESWPNITPGNDVINTGIIRVEVTRTTLSGYNIIDLTSKVCNEVTSKAVDGVVVFVDCQTANILSKHLLFRQLIHTVVIREFCDVKDLISAKQPCDIVNRVISDVTDHKSWRKILLYHDNTLGSSCLIDLITIFSRKSISTRIVNTSNYMGKKPYTHFLSKYRTDAVIVLGTIDTVQDILHRANVDNIPQDYWIAMTNNKQLPVINGTEGNFVFLRQPRLDEDEFCLTSIKNDYEEHLSESISRLVTVFSTAVVQYNITSLESLSCHDNILLQNRTKVMNVAKRVFLQNENSFEVCSTLPNQQERFGHMGKWSTISGLDLLNGRLFGNDFWNFNNATLLVAALPFAPYVYVRQYGNTTQYRGFCIDILDELALKFNFSYQILQPADNAYGSLKENGQWSGMVGMVMRKEVDFAIGPFTISSARESVIDFTTTYMEDHSAILTKRPHEEANKEMKVFKPLSVSVWGSIIAAIIIISLTYFVIIKLSPFNSNTKEMTKTELMIRSCWLIYGSLLEQDGDLRPLSTSGRVMLGTWWIFTILVLSIYTANLAAFLTVNIIESPINSLEELANHDEIRPLVLFGTNTQTLFKTAHTGVYRSIWEKMADMPIVSDLNAALRYVKDDQYAFISDFSALDYIMRQDCTTYTIADEVFNNFGFGFVLQENAPYLGVFNQAIMKLAEGGFILKWQNHWWNRSESCSTTDTSGPAQSLGMDSLLGLFYFYLITVGIAIMLFIFELLFNSNSIQCRLMFLKNRQTKTKPDMTSEL